MRVRPQRAWNRTDRHRGIGTTLVAAHPTDPGMQATAGAAVHRVARLLAEAGWNLVLLKKVRGMPSSLIAEAAVMTVLVAAIAA